MFLLFSTLELANMNKYLVFIVILSFFILIDLYSYRGLKVFFSRFILPFTLVFWSIPFIFLSIIGWYFFYHQFQRAPGEFVGIYRLFGFFLLFYVPKLFFIFFMFLYDIKKVFVRKKNHGTNRTRGTRIKRIDFLKKVGLVASIIPVYPIIQGMTVGRFRFKVYRESINFKKLPDVFDGYRIVQISDIHLGSLYGNEKEIQKAIEIINGLNADLVLFTGDLVNNFSEELIGWENILNKIKSKEGKYSVLGNHDYGDYYRWNSKREQLEDHKKLIEFHKNIGFRLLLNEHETIKKNNDKLVIAGVENWGLPPFRQSGDLNKALKGVKSNDFTILMSHDPTHWDEQVKNNTQVDLTLSGHTHGMQFGVKLGNKQWSPASWKYPKWAGLYSENNQFLYVNRGLGYIGMPARIGMDPEITLIELRKL